MLINNYAVIVDVENSSCGVIIDPSEYTISFFDREFLEYKIDPKNKILTVYSKNNEIKLLNINKELIYYGFKTDVLLVFIGDRLCKEPPINAYEAVLS